MKLSSNNYMCTCAGRNKYNEHSIPVTIYISYAQLASKTDLSSAIIESQETLDNLFRPGMAILDRTHPQPRQQKSTPRSTVLTASA